MAREVTLVDAGIGNLASVERALIQVGAGVRVTSDPDKVATSRMVVFPGQSAFGPVSQAIVDGAMGAALKMVIERGDPFLGICMGMQLLFDGSDENGGQEGLRVLPGRCRRFPSNREEKAEPGATHVDPSPASATGDDVAPPQSVAQSPAQTASPAQQAPSPAPVTQAPSSAPMAQATPSQSAPSPATQAPAGTVSAEQNGGIPAPPPWGASQSPEGTTSADAVQQTAAPEPAAPEPAVQQAPEPEPAPAPLMRRIKVPHMGWNEVEPTGDHYYFVHSFYVEPGRSEDVMWMSRYGGIRFPAAVRRGNVLGCQFHPEKSQRAGLRFLRAFLLGGWG
ncbi:MAG: hypothetical protein AAF799_44485 [Myxococcota bacterium]